MHSNNLILFRTYGFILEGFPRTAEEARYLAATGLFPDVTISLNVSSDDVCNRLMPPLLDKWIIERNKSRVEKEKKKEEKLKKRVENVFGFVLVPFIQIVN